MKRAYKIDVAGLVRIAAAPFFWRNRCKENCEGTYLWRCPPPLVCVGTPVVDIVKVLK